MAAKRHPTLHQLKVPELIIDAGKRPESNRIKHVAKRNQAGPKSMGGPGWLWRTLRIPEGYKQPVLVSY